MISWQNVFVPSYSENLAPIRAGVVSILEKTNLGIGARWVLVNFLLADGSVLVIALSWSPCGRYASSMGFC